MSYRIFIGYSQCNTLFAPFRAAAECRRGRGQMLRQQLGSAKANGAIGLAAGTARACASLGAVANKKQQTDPLRQRPAQAQWLPDNKSPLESNRLFPRSAEL